MRYLLLPVAILLLGLGLAPAVEVEDEIVEITIERTACFGTCPIDKVSIQNNGDTYYHGTKFVDNLGDFKGWIPITEFERLTKLIVRNGFSDLQPRYTEAVSVDKEGKVIREMVSDQPSVIVSVRRGEKTTKVEDYGGTGPLELWTIERTIQGCVADVKWAKAN